LRWKQLKMLLLYIMRCDCRPKRNREDVGGE
jgi:hypothetical protein